MIEGLVISLYVYLALGGLIGRGYLDMSKIVDDDKRVARGLLLFVLWGPVAVFYAIKLPIVGVWWVLHHAFKGDE